MTTLRRAACLVVLCLAAGSAPAFAGVKQDALVAEVNSARHAHGLGSLAASPSLNRSASGLAGQLMQDNWFGHAGAIDAGGGFRTLGEALSLHSGKRPRYGATVQGWLASPPHRALVLSTAFTRVGAGMARGPFNGRPSTIWVLHLGAY
jgi:uncharacterized protein YkwD